MPSNCPSFTIFASQRQRGPSSHSFGSAPNTCAIEKEVGNNYPPLFYYDGTERDKMENSDRWVAAALSKLSHSMECIHEADPGSPFTGECITCGCASCCHTRHPSNNFSYHNNHNVRRKNSGTLPFSFPYLAAGMESVNENERKGPHMPLPFFSSGVIPSVPLSQLSGGDLADEKGRGVSLQVQRRGEGEGEHHIAVTDESLWGGITSAISTTRTTHGMRKEQEKTAVSLPPSHALHFPTRQRATPHNIEEMGNEREYKKLEVNEKKGEGQHHYHDVAQNEQNREDIEEEILLSHGGDRDESFFRPPLPASGLSVAFPTVGVDQTSSTTATTTLHVPKSWRRVKKSPSQPILTARKSVGSGRRDGKEGKNYPRDLFSHIAKEEGLFAAGKETTRNFFVSTLEAADNNVPHSEAGGERIGSTTTAQKKKLKKLTKSSRTPSTFTSLDSSEVKGEESEPSRLFFTGNGNTSRQISSSLPSSSFYSPSSCVGVTSASRSTEEGGLPTWKKHHRNKGGKSFFSLSSTPRDPSGAPSPGEAGDSEAPRKRGSKKRRSAGGGGGKKNTKETEPSWDADEGVWQRRRGWCMQHVPFMVRFLLAFLVIGLANFCFTFIAFVLYIKVGKAAGL